MPARRRGHHGIAIAAEGSADGHPEALYVHANGFCKELWRPIASSVSDASESSWLSIDLRGHGDSDRGRAPYEWHSLALDVLGVLEGARGVVGVGHSMGGAVLTRAETIRPGTFRALVLVEPVITPGPYERREFPLATGAQRRRPSFDDRDVARQRFAGGPFGTWTDEMLDLYVDHAFRQSDEGWSLKCPPEVEADFFREGYNHDTWDRLDDVRCPVILMTGAESRTHTGEYLDMLRDRFTNVESIVVPDTGHFVPMERPDEVAAAIAKRF